MVKYSEIFKVYNSLIYYTSNDLDNIGVNGHLQ